MPSRWLAGGTQRGQQLLHLARPRPPQPPLIRRPRLGRPLAEASLGRPVQVAQKVQEVQNREGSPGREVQREDRPVVLLPVADVPLGPRPVQAPTLDLSRHLPAERLTVGGARHHRPHQLPRPATLLLAPALRPGRIGRRPRGRRPAPRLDLRGQPGRLHSVEELRWRLRLRVGGVRCRGEGLAAGDLGLAPGGMRHPRLAGLLPGLISAAVDHHRGDLCHLRPRRRQPPLAERGHVGIASRGPLPTDSFAESVQMAGTDGQISQFPQGLAGLLERRGPDRLSHGLAQGGGAVPLGAQAELMVEGGKTRPDRPCTGTDLAAV